MYLYNIYLLLLFYFLFIFCMLNCLVDNVGTLVQDVFLWGSRLLCVMSVEI